MPFKKGETPKGAKPFKKGKSGNPTGRPKKIPEIDILLADILSEEKDGMEAAKAVLLSLRNKAIKGDVRAIEVLLDRAYGKAKSSIDLTTNGNNLNIPAISWANDKT
tara:strand:+ start:3286 stop:3606 length:321 start_codon:yes stop_codon:yes gene_type:complete